MIEFTNLIRVSPINDAQSRTFDFLADHFDFQPQPDDNEGGQCWNCDQTFFIDMPDKEAQFAFDMPRLSIVTLKSTDQRTYDIGTSEVPARVSITRHLNRARLMMRCTMLTDPLR